MAKITDGTLKNWKDNDIVRSDDYKREREILRLSVNDNFERILNRYDKLEMDEMLNEMKGEGWDSETIKNNHDLIQDILLTRYTKLEVDAFLDQINQTIDGNHTNLQDQITSNDQDILTIQTDFATKNQLSSTEQILQGQLNFHDTRLNAVEDRATSLELDVNDRYTKAETDDKVTYVQSQIDNLNDVYSTDAERIAAVNNAINQFEIADDDLEELIQNKANSSDVYSKAEVEQRLVNKADSSNVYTRTDANSLLANKTDKTGNHDGTWKGLLPSDIGAGEMNASRITYLEDQMGNQERNTQTLQKGVSILDGEANAPGTFQLEGKTLTSLGNSNLEDSKYYVLADKNTKVKTFKEDTWKQGVAKVQRSQSLTSKADFTGKVSGSAVENPNTSYRVVSAVLNSPPSFGGSWVELSDGTGSNSYSRIQTINGNLMIQSSSSDTSIAQNLISFNLVEQVERKHGLIPAADKVQWVKDNINTLACNWHGYGSSPSGNNARIRCFIDNAGGIWDGTDTPARYHTSGSVQKLTFSSTYWQASGIPSTIVDSNGFIHFLAHAEASDGVTASTISTDFVELDVELKTTAVLDKRPILSRIATYEGKVPGSTVENPHKSYGSSVETSLLAPSSFTAEATSPFAYDRLAMLDGPQYSYLSRVGNGSIAQQLFSINIVEEVERKLGKIPKSTLADKVQWCKDNVVKLTGYWYGYGSGPTGNNATFTGWRNFGSWYPSGQSHNYSTVTRLTRTIDGATNMSSTIEDDGFAYFLAYAEASDGVTASTINTDYFECEIEMKPGAELWHPSVPLYEVQQSEYDKILVDWTADQVLNRYPRIQGSQHVQNPYVMAEGENLLPPFYEWADITSGKGAIISPYEVSIQSNTAGSYYRCFVPVAPNQTYHYSVEQGSYAYFYFTDKDKNRLTGIIRAPISSVAPSNAAFLEIVVNSDSNASVHDFKNPMLTLGSEPKPFVPRNPSYLFAETKLGSIGNKKDTLFYEDGTYKRRKVIEKDVVLDGSLAWNTDTDYNGCKRFNAAILDGTYTFANGIISKYTGSLVKFRLSWDSGDLFQIGSANNVFYITVSDSDSGFGESYTPSASDIKRYFNGWKYTDGITWTSVTGNGETADESVALGSMPTDYVPYKLSYVLATPKTEDVTTEGAITVNGKTQVEVGSGIVVREKANVLVGGSYDYINSDADGYRLDHKVEKLLNIYENNKLITNWLKTNLGYGKERAALTKGDYDTEAEYTVTYLVLDRHLFSSNPNDVKATYSRNLRDAHDDLTKRYEDTATKVSVLDRTVYELLVWKLKHESEGGV